MKTKPHLAEQLRKYHALDTHDRARTVEEHEQLEGYAAKSAMSHRAALKLFEKVKREASAVGDRVSGPWMAVL